MKRLVLILMLLASPLWAVQPDEILDDPVLEERAREISSGLRCLVCRNESIDDSNADLARDLRLLVRERLVAGGGDNCVRMLPPLNLTLEEAKAALLELESGQAAAAADIRAMREFLDSATRGIVR